MQNVWDPRNATLEFYAGNFLHVAIITKSMIAKKLGNLEFDNLG